MRLSQIISILATFTALTGAFFLIRDNMTLATRAMGMAELEQVSDETTNFN